MISFKDIDGKRVPFRLLKNRTICGPKYVDMSKTMIIDKESMRNRNAIDKLISRFYDHNEIDTVIYTVDEEWTKDLAINYFYFLMELSKDKMLNIHDMAHYMPDPQNIYSNKCRCNAMKNNTVILKESDICNSVEDLVLEEKCTFCPIKSGCPSCRLSKKSWVCYMHQAEAIICILTYNDKGFIYRGSIPHLWIRDFLGDCAANIIDSIRNTSSLRWTYNIGSADVILTIRSECKDEVIRALVYEEVHYEIRENGDILVIPTEDLIVDNILNRLDRNGVIYTYEKKYMTFEDFKNGIIKSYVPQDPYYIEDVSFSLDKPADITDIIATSACKPQSVYTQFMIRTILKYIQPGMKVLDIGCGKGMLCMVSLLKGADVTAIDSDETAIIDIHKTMDVNNYTDDDILTIHTDAKSFIANCNKTYDMIFGNLTASIQCSAVLPYIDKIMTENSIYLIGGFNSLIEKHLYKYICEGTNLSVSEIYYYNSIEIMVLKKRGDIE